MKRKRLFVILERSASGVIESKIDPIIAKLVVSQGKALIALTLQDDKEKAVAYNVLCLYDDK